MRQANLSQNSYIALFVIGMVAVFGFLGAFTGAVVLKSSNATTNTTQSFSGLEYFNDSREIGLLGGCDESDGMKVLSGNLWGCGQDAITVDVTGSAPTRITTIEAINDSGECFTVAGTTLTIDVDCLAGSP